MALITDVMKTIANPVNKLILWLEETYKVDRDETMAKWFDISGMKITAGEVADISGTKSEVKGEYSSATPKSKKIPKTKALCQYTFTSGQKTGEQCSTKPKGGADFCSTHRPKTDTPKSNKTTEVINPDFESDPEQVVKDPKVSKRKIKDKKTANGNASEEYNTDTEPLDDNIDLNGY
jgi:hypothetical protein